MVRAFYLELGWKLLSSSLHIFRVLVPAQLHDGQLVEALQGHPGRTRAAEPEEESQGCWPSGAWPLPFCCLCQPACTLSGLMEHLCFMRRRKNTSSCVRSVSRPCRGAMRNAHRRGAALWVSPVKGGCCLPLCFSDAVRGQIHSASAWVSCPALESEHLGPATAGKALF